jgi:hypothetical protein
LIQEQRCRAEEIGAFNAGSCTAELSAREGMPCFAMFTNL